MLSNESVNMHHTIHCWSEDAEESNNNMKKDLWIILLRRTSWIIPSGMSQSSGVDFPGSPKQLHLMDLHSRGWLTTSNTRLKVPPFFFFFLSQCSRLFFLFQYPQLCLYASTLRKFHDYPVWHCRYVTAFLPTYSGTQAMKNRNYRLWQMQL